MQEAKKENMSISGASVMTAIQESTYSMEQAKQLLGTCISAIVILSQNDWISISGR